MGLYDDVENIKVIQELTGKTRVSYVGLSLGATQMLYALAHDDNSFMAENLHTAAFLAPCIVANSQPSMIA